MVLSPISKAGSEGCDELTVLPASEGMRLDSACDVTLIGDYEIINEIARGGMGVVYLAKHRHLGRQVALKTLLLNCDQDASAADRFALEAEAVARFDHPGIVTIYEVGKHCGQPFLVMKLIDGGSLSQLLHNGPLDVNRALAVAIEVSEAIAHAHQRGVIHRDLKPANILLDHVGHAVVTDFGVAKFLEASRCQLTTAGEPIGTPHYMPPEQADASRGPIGTASDVYSIGAIMYAMLTGRPPFQAASPIDVMLQVLANDPVSLRQLNSTVPMTLEAIVMKCLQKDPRKRYQTALELTAELCNFRDGKPTIAKPMRGLRRMVYSLRKHFMVATVSGSIVTLLLITTLIVVISHVKLIQQKLELEANVADLTDVLASERNLFRVRVSGLRNETLSEAGLAAERLASYGAYIEKQNPDLAARLAVESIGQSKKAGQAFVSSAVESLRNYLAKSDSNQQAIQSQSSLSADEVAAMVAEVDSTLNFQLTQDQRVLFGIEEPSVAPEYQPAGLLEKP